MQYTKAKLIGYTTPVLDLGVKLGDVKELIAYCARVSNPSNQNNTATTDKLLNYLIKHKHWSPFEMASATVEIETTRDIARQLLRHRSFSFQEFCVAGDTMITLELPGAAQKGKRSAYKRSIEHLYKLQSKNQLPECVRVFDEDTKTFVNANIKEVFCTGLKPVFKITLANGKSITATKEHKFFTPDGFKTLEDAVGLIMQGNTAAMKNQTFLACNGIEAHQDKDWLSSTKQAAIANKGGLNFIAETAGVSIHTIRKWLKKHSLQFTKQEVAMYTPIWNKGLHGYSLPKHSMETIEKMKKSAKRGEESNLWKGGADRGERQKIADWCNSNRTEFLKQSDYKCNRCESNDKLELHHKLAVVNYPEFAYQKDNIEVLCKYCHRNHHKLNGDMQTWRSKSKGNRLTIEWSAVTNIEYMGEQMTYDMEVNHSSHNYVGNGILTHNSQRYADPTKELKFVLREARLQDQTNRQNSIKLDTASEDEDVQFLIYEWNRRQQEVIELVRENYTWAINAGIAKEQARSILPEGNTMSKLYVQGTLRSFIHYIEVRTEEGTQLEHQELAFAVAKAIAGVFNLKG